MLKPTVKRGLMLDFIPDNIQLEQNVNKDRVFKLNDKKVLSGDIVYVMSREFRLEDNFALIFGLELAKTYDKKLKICIYLDKDFYSDSQSEFLNKGLSLLKENLNNNGFCYYESNILPSTAAAIVFDFSAINQMKAFSKTINCAAFEVDSHNIIPSRFISQKQEYSAATLRRKVYANIADFLTEYPILFKIQKSDAYNVLSNFISTKLDNYAEYKNNPNVEITSNLSPYLHFGFISSQRVALEVLKSGAQRENKETFLEELIVRKELADNFCLYSLKYKSLESIPEWAKVTLSQHSNDLRTYVYSRDEFEYGKTHDELWNVAQLHLIKRGYIHGFLRMYWAKKILEWSISPEFALETAIYLNDKYALDGFDSNGYVGILWAIGGVHDRPFANRLVTGKIRYMSLLGCKKKFDVVEYVSHIRGALSC